MDRSEAKRRISVLLSDLGLIGKIREGRTDKLADEHETAPEFWKEAVLRPPPKGSRDWRWAKEYALEGKVPQRKRRAPKASRELEVNADGKVPVQEGECLRCAMEGGHDGPCVYHE